MASEEMYEIINAPNLLRKYRDFDVYYINDGRYGLYKKKGIEFDVNRIKAGMHPEHLYISLQDRIMLIRNQTKRINDKLKKELKKDPVKARKRLIEVVELTLSEPRSEILEDIKDTINIVVDEYLSSQDVIKNLVKVSVKDYSTQLHLTNVMLFSLGYAHYSGFDARDMRLFGLMGLLHDVGKVEIPDEILKAKRSLTDEEFDVIKKHPQNGWKMLKKCKFDEKIPICALEHHERLDGSGYPAGKKAKDLNAHSRALAIVDVFEALTTWRPYKDPIHPLKALGIMMEEVETEKLDRVIFKQFAYSVVGLTC